MISCFVFNNSYNVIPYFFYKYLRLQTKSKLPIITYVPTYLEYLLI